jgi:putative flippase GtrA
MGRPSSSGQLLRFALVGLVSNGLLYGAYLALIALGVPYRVAMTATYLGGVVLGFAAHRRWTFRHRGPGGASAVRYAAAYGGGYLLNLVGLHLLVERGGIAPAWAQGLMIVVVAAFLYFVQKHWVFRRPQTVAGTDGPAPRAG